MKNIKIMSGVVVILFIVFGAIYINKPYEEKEYLNKNYSSINLEYDDFTGLDILTKDLKGKKIVLSGEEHGLDKNDKMKFKMLKYLQKEIGVNYLLSEIGYADAYFLNKYLETGDEEILMEHFSHYPIQKYANENHYELYKNVYELNQTLPENEQIKIIGVDINTSLTDEYIVEILKDKSTMTEELDLLLKELKDFDYYSPILYKNLMNKVNNLLKDIELNKETYMKMFGDDFEGFEYVVRSLRDLCESFIVDAKDRYNMRDSFMYENFKKLDSKLDNPIYFGQFGGAHIYQDVIFSNFISRDIKYFGTYLNSDEKYKGKVLSIHYGYQSNELDLHGSSLKVEEKLFEEFLNKESEEIIFKLNSVKSPYTKKGIYPFGKATYDYKNTPTTNYYEYLILLKNAEYSKALIIIR